MIVDVPTADDFNASGTDFLNIAWGMIVDLSLDLEGQQELWIGDDDLVTDDYWKAAQRPLATALSLVQQGTEFLLKGHIATVSPYLLLSGDPSSWPSKCHERNVRFSEFKTIEAQDLIRAYNTVKDRRLPPEFQTRYENLRSKRNTIMHSVDPNLRIQPKDLLIEILEICHYLIAPKTWIKTRKDFIDKAPPSLINDLESILGDFFLEIEHVSSSLQPAESDKYFGFSKRSRRYICPDCYREVDDYFDDDNMPKFALLQPNEPTSTSLYCFVCNKVIDVSREDCRSENCPGNVISVKGLRLCLTCVSYQDT
jgi:hypothetical protein